MKNYNNRIVLITGGAHGLGLELAKIYNKLRAKVVVLDNNQNSIQHAKKELPEALFFKCDITKKDELYHLATKIKENVGIPYILVNNAGVVENSYFLHCEDYLIERTINVNIMGHFWILKSFLPEMIKIGEGNICQVASAAGLIGVSGMVAYCSSKHAVVGLSRALEKELSCYYKSKIKISTICPSFINTGMFDKVKPAHLTPILDQKKMAKIIFKAIDKDKRLVLEPFMVKFLPFLRILLPYKAFNLLTKLFKVDSAMENINSKLKIIK